MGSSTTHLPGYSFRALGRDFRSLEAAKAYADGYTAGASDATLKDPDWEIFVFRVWQGYLLVETTKILRWNLSSGWQDVPPGS